IIVPIPPQSLRTDRLYLRPTRADDAGRVAEIFMDFGVTRMLLMASFPPNRHEIEQWFADHEREWKAGQAYRLAVLLEERMVGVPGFDGIGERGGSLGYGLERAVGGRGYAFEAALAVTRFAAETVDLRRLRAGHAYDNPASGRVLTKLGFDRLDLVER